jgi:hypothetical protein
MSRIGENAYIQGIFELPIRCPTAWTTGQRMIYPAYAKRLCVSQRNAIHLFKEWAFRGEDPPRQHFSGGKAPSDKKGKQRETGNLVKFDN